MAGIPCFHVDLPGLGFAFFWCDAEFFSRSYGRNFCWAALFSPQAGFIAFEKGALAQKPGFAPFFLRSPRSFFGGYIFMPPLCKKGNSRVVCGKPPGHPQHSNGNWHMALGDRRSERATAGSALGCARERHPRLGLAVRCGDLALSQKKHAFFCTFFTCSQNTPMALFSLISKVFGHV